MSRIVELAEIQKVLPQIDVVQLIEAGFVEYSRGRVVVPPVGELVFDDPPGDLHIKYGYIKGDAHFVVKIAAGFYNNPAIGLSSSQGLMLVFCSRTGVLEAVLLDEGHLTNIRTAAAGAVAAKYLAPKSIESIGVLGAGLQAELQLQYVQKVRPCHRVLFWTPQEGEVEPFRQRLSDLGFTVENVSEPQELAASCQLIVAATPSVNPLLFAEDIRAGTHITAVGSDTAEKIELHPAVLGAADLVVVDSLEQSTTRGEVYRAVKAAAINRDQVRELGEVIIRGRPARTNDTEISVCDLTGVAVQDIQIAKAVLGEIIKEERQ